eukprot:Sspe_Gene.50503::Locus_28115_Transcript_1_1_Confidence_1.000_Length_1605::g.50503::m.50503
MPEKARVEEAQALLEAQRKEMEKQREAFLKEQQAQQREGLKVLAKAQGEADRRAAEGEGRWHPGRIADHKASGEQFWRNWVVYHFVTDVRRDEDKQTYTERLEKLFGDNRWSCCGGEGMTPRGVVCAPILIACVSAGMELRSTTLTDSPSHRPIWPWSVLGTSPKISPPPHDPTFLS